MILPYCIKAKRCVSIMLGVTGGFGLMFDKGQKQSSKLSCDNSYLTFFSLVSFSFLFFLKIFVQELQIFFLRGRLNIVSRNLIILQKTSNIPLGISSKGISSKCSLLKMFHLLQHGYQTVKCVTAVKKRDLIHVLPVLRVRCSKM